MQTKNWLAFVLMFLLDYSYDAKFSFECSFTRFSELIQKEAELLVMAMSQRRLSLPAAGQAPLLQAVRVDQVGCSQTIVVRLPPTESIVELRLKSPMALPQRTLMKISFGASTTSTLGRIRASNEHECTEFGLKWCCFVQGKCSLRNH